MRIGFAEIFYRHDDGSYTQRPPLFEGAALALLLAQQQGWHSGFPVLAPVYLRGAPWYWNELFVAPVKDEAGDVEHAILRNLKGLGIRISVDDFGAGSDAARADCDSTPEVAN